MVRDDRATRRVTRAEPGGGAHILCVQVAISASAITPTAVASAIATTIATTVSIAAAIVASSTTCSAHR